MLLGLHSVVCFPALVGGSKGNKKTSPVRGLVGVRVEPEGWLVTMPEHRVSGGMLHSVSNFLRSQTRINASTDRRPTRTEQVVIKLQHRRIQPPRLSPQGLRESIWRPASIFPFLPCIPL